MIFTKNMSNYGVCITKHNYETYPLDSYHFQKRCVVKPIRYEIVPNYLF